MARGRAARADRGGKSAADKGPEPAPAGSAKSSGKLPLPSPVAGTNLMIADIVLRAAGGMLRERMEKGLIVRTYDRTRADKLVDGRGVATSLALWGASRLARRSPIGLALVAGGLAAKVFYDRGRRLEKKRRAKQALKDES